ncbi:MAG TPA: hypothetical protein VL994_13620, partial [Steroidobacteraceae bacterium]|nr:hypothetical protein [Steroidobacteraceae bacterium]
MLTHAIAALTLSPGAATATRRWPGTRGPASPTALDAIASGVPHVSDNSRKVFVGTRPVSFFGVEGDSIDLGRHIDQYLGTGAGPSTRTPTPSPPVRWAACR